MPKRIYIDSVYLEIVPASRDAVRTCAQRLTLALINFRSMKDMEVGDFQRVFHTSVIGKLAKQR